MISFLRNRQGLTLTGSGPRVLLLALLASVPLILLALVSPSTIQGPWKPHIAGVYWIVLGGFWWASSLVQLILAFRQGHLATTGAYGICRNPLYSSIVWRVLPGVAWTTGQWVWLVGSAALWAGIQWFVPAEEARLTQVFGEVYRDYQTRVGRTLPRWRGSAVVVVWLRRRPVQAFVVGTLAWSWGWWSLIGVVGNPGDVVHHFDQVWPFVVIGGFGPTLAGLLLTGIVSGRDGWRALGRRLTTSPQASWWPVLFLIPLLTSVVPLTRWLLGQAPGPEAWLPLLAPGLALGLTAGLMEEFGWRGFLLPRLLERWSPWRSAWMTGLVWGGLWHGYADWWGLGDRGWTALPLIVLLGPVLLTAWSLVLTRTYQRTKASLWMSILVHASISSSALILGQSYSNEGEELAWTTLQAAIDVAGALLFWWWTRTKPAEGPTTS